MAKFEHVFEIAVSVEDKNHLKFRIVRDNDIVLTKARTGAGYGTYDFELGSAEFEDDEKMLRKQRKIIKKVLKDIKSIKAKIEV